MKSKNSLEQAEPTVVFHGDVDVSSSISQVSQLAKRLFAVVAFVAGILSMVLAFLIISTDATTRDPAIQNWSGAIAAEILIALGTSILSSIVFYWLYSQAAEERVLRDIAVGAGKAAAAFATSLFATRYENLLPSKIYPETELPLAEYYNDITLSLVTSRTYKYKGDAASYTTYRLFQLAQHQIPMVDKEITILLLDPREPQLFRDRVAIEIGNLCSKERLEEEAAELRQNVFISLVALFDICHTMRIDVAFHRERLFFVSQILDDGIFLSYYTGSRFPTDYYYTAKTFAYRAHLINFRQNYDASSVFPLKGDLSETAFEKWLQQDLGCNVSLSQLRKLKDERHGLYQKITTFPFPAQFNRTKIYWNPKLSSQDLPS